MGLHVAGDENRSSTLMNRREDARMSPLEQRSSPFFGVRSLAAALDSPSFPCAFSFSHKASQSIQGVSLRKTTYVRLSPKRKESKAAASDRTPKERSPKRQQATIVPRISGADDAFPSPSKAPHHRLF